MNPALLILLPIIFAIFLTGGISVKSPDRSETSSEPVNLIEGGIAGIFNTLQINSLIPGSNSQVTPIPTNPPGITTTPVPTFPPGVTSTPVPTSPPGFTPRPTQPGQNLCTTNPDCSAAGNCPSTRLQNCTLRGPQPCTPVQAVVSCTPPPSPTRNPACVSSSNTCQQFNPACPCPGDPGGIDTGFRITCSNGECVRLTYDNYRNVDNNCRASPTWNDYCRGMNSQCPGTGTYGTYCIAKPVIYLYPLKVTRIDVSIETTGQIVISDPLYPEGGWKKVEAHPDGSLYYQGEKYRELFYETSVHNFIKPENGIVIKTEELESALGSYITKLGLTKAEERIEFLDWWLPRLRELNSPYILFSILDSKEKTKTDKVNISPKPDTFIEFIAYFKPLSNPISVSPLILPSIPPERIGFTAVEWGGVIDDK